MTIAKYTDFIEDGDYLLVDLKRYSKDGNGALSLGFLSWHREAKNAEFWQMKRPIFAQAKEVPLVFRKPAEQPDENIDDLRDSIRPWLVSIDRWIDNNWPEPDTQEEQHSHSAREMLREIREKLQNDKAFGSECRYQNLFDEDKKPLSKYSVSLKSIHGVGFLTFNWKHP
jgi:hypothetical protein